MTFIPPAFQAGLMNIQNNHPPHAVAFANAWADAFFQGFGNPIPPSTTGMAARQAAFSIFLNAFEAFNPHGNPAGINIMKAGVTAFAAQLAIGMLPAFAAVPPTSPYPGFEQYASQIGDSPSKATAPGLMTAASVPWFMTGIAVNTTSGVTIPWA